jgi:hypothetical protein
VAFAQTLRRHGLREGLLFLNRRTTHRCTGVFRFDGDMLRSVAMGMRGSPVVSYCGSVILDSAGARGERSATSTRPAAMPRTVTCR